MKIVCKDTGEIARSYRDYLKTEHWKNIRHAIISASQGVCQSCKQFKPPLDVHHKNYDRLGQELFSDITPICRDCHESKHQHQHPNITLTHISLGHSFDGILIPLCCWESRNKTKILYGLKIAATEKEASCPHCKRRLKQHIKKSFLSGRQPLKPKNKPDRNLMIDFF